MIIVKKLWCVSILLILLISVNGQGLIMEDSEDVILKNKREKLFFEKPNNSIDDTILYQATDTTATYQFGKNKFKTLLIDRLTKDSTDYTIEFVKISNNVKIVSHENTFYNIDTNATCHLSEPITSELTYFNLWSGIELIFYEERNTLMYDFYINANTELEVLQFKIKDVTNLKLNAEGELEFTTYLGKYHKSKPLVYQVLDNKITFVESKYRIDGDLISFQLSEYDTTKALIISRLTFSKNSIKGGFNNE